MWMDLVWVPKFSRRPEAMDAAMPSAWLVCSWLRPSRYAQPAAAPIPAVTLLQCQPLAWSRLAQIRPSLHVTSVAMRKPSSSSRPEQPVSSPIASSAGSTATVGCPKLEEDVSSSSSSWPEIPLTKAASRPHNFSLRPGTVQPPPSVTVRACRTAAVSLPAIMAPMVSRMDRRAR